MKRIKLSLLFLLLFPRSAQSWWSFEKANIPWSSHRLITQSAMSLIQETGEYPDLNKFSSVILEATTGDANDAKAHGKILAGDPDYPLANEAGRFNGGPFDLWQKRALARYNAQDFAGTENSSYYYFALMTHLLQDQAVPAHAANIYHGQIIGDEGCYSLLWNTTVPCDPDDLELYSGGRGPGFIVRGKEYGKKAEDYYYNGKNIPASIVRQTQSKLTGWEYPDTGDIAKWRGSQYWIKNNVTYSGEGFIGNLANTGEAGWWGHYGGTPNNTDMYLYLTLSTPFGKTDSPVIAENQLKEAAEFTAGMLMAVSRSLPPLIKEPYINNVPASDATVATVYTNAPNTIRFKLMDNRTSAVDLHLEVDAYGGRPIVSVSTIAVFLSSGTMLPWELQYTTQWDGKYADGTPIPSGDHKLFASGTDADGNRFEYEIGAFMVSNGPQLGVFVCEGGFTNLSSGGLIQNVPVFQHPCSEVKIVIHKDRSPITEVTVNTPSGSITLPGGDVVNYTLPASPDGHYTITAKDQTGPPNSASFTLTTLDFQSDMDASKSTYGSGEFTPQLTFKGTSSPSTFARIDFCKAEPVSGGGLSSRCGPIVESKTTSPAMFEVPNIFNTNNFTLNMNTSAPESLNYGAIMYDTEGNSRSEFFVLSLVKTSFFDIGLNTYSPSGTSFESETVDSIARTSILSGAMAYSKNEWITNGSEVLGATIPASGALVTSQPLGSITYSVITGDQPTGGTEHLIGTAEIKCNMSTGCYKSLSTYSTTPFALKRYYRAKSVVTPADISTVLSSACSDSYEEKLQHPTYCSKGFSWKLHPKVGPLTIWGVGYKLPYSDIGPNSLGAIVRVGTDVTVNPASWLGITFSEVTTAGSVGIPLYNLPYIPGVLPLRTFEISPVDLVYSGDVRVDVNYSGVNLTPGQIASMRAIKVNDSLTRDIEIYPATAAGGVASFNTRALGTFMLTVPTYTSPAVYTGGDAINGAPAFSLLAGNAGVTLATAQAGSETGNNYVNILRSYDLVAAGDFYELGPSGMTFSPPGAITMRYDKNVVRAKGLFENRLAIYQISADGTYFSRLPNLALNTEKGELTADVNELHSVFVIASDSELDQRPDLTSDLTPPISNLVFGIPAYEINNQTLLSTASLVYIDAYDQETAGQVVSGVATNYYLIDADPAVTEPLIYREPFYLSEGVHTVWYKSVDGVGNANQWKTGVYSVDGTAPHTEVWYNGQKADKNLFIAENSSISLAAQDPQSQGIASEVGMTVFDVSTTPCVAFRDYPQSPGDCRRILYTEAFALPVGTHTVYYASMDNTGNMEEVKQININSGSGAQQDLDEDITPPVTTINFSKSPYVVDNKAVISSTVLVSLNAVDPDVPWQILSGFATSYYLVDADTSTNQLIPYTEPFSLSEGARIVRYASKDTAGNSEIIKSATIYVDGTAPNTTAIINGQVVAASTTVHILTIDPVALSTADPVSTGVAAGIGKTACFIDVSPALCSNWGTSSPTAPFGSCLNSLYTVPFNLAVGTHTVYYASVDNVGNVEQKKSIQVVVDYGADTLPPVTNVFINGIAVSSGSIGYLRVGSTITLVAEDFSQYGAGSGVAYTSYRVKNAISGQELTAGTYSTPIVVMGEGAYDFYYQSMDKSDNLEPANKITRQADGTPPVTTAMAGTRLVETNAEITQSEGITLTAVDPVSGGVASEVNRIGCFIDVSPESCGNLNLNVSTAPFGSCQNHRYTSTFTLAIGTHSVYFASMDNVGNLEGVKSISFTVREFNQDVTPPVTTISFDGPAFGAGPVYVSNHTGLILQSADNLSGVAARYYAVDSSTFNVYTGTFTIADEGHHALKYYSMDVVGNTETIKTSSITVDNTAPISELEVVGLSQNLEGALYVLNGSSVAISASDALSGVMGIGCFIDISPLSCESLVVVDTAAPFGSCKNYIYTGPFMLAVGTHTVSFASRDNVGNQEDIKSTNFTVSENNSSSDITPPVTTTTISGVSGQNNWYVSSVTVTLVSTDDISGIRETLYSLDGSAAVTYDFPFPVAAEGEHVLTAYATDNFGNTESTKTLTFEIDISSPVVGYSITPSSSSSGWNNTPVDVVFTGTDTVSRIAYCSSSMSVTNEGHTPVTGYCTDYAGLSSTVSFTVNIDTTAPVITPIRTPANENGWTNEDVTVSFVCSDGLSGPGDCPAAITYSQEGVNISTVVRAFDIAGNYSDMLIDGINIDRAPPSSTATLVGAYKNGYYSSSVAITIISSDTRSGPAKTFYSLDGVGPIEYQNPVEVNAEGPHALLYYAQDKAGNNEVTQNLEFNIDVTRPEVTYSITPPPNYRNWSNTPVEVTFSGTDLTSDIDHCTPAQIVSTEGANQQIVGSCVDLAGNISYSTAIVNVDLSSPSVSAVGMEPANAYGWYNAIVVASVTCVDALSEVVTCPESTTLFDEGENVSAAVTVYDNAGNVSTECATGINIDKTAPESTVSGVYQGGNYDSPAIATIEAADNLSKVLAKEYYLDETPPFVTYTEPVRITTAGYHTITFRSIDKAGNTEEPETIYFNINPAPADTEAPVTTVSIDGNIGQNDWYISPVAVTLVSSDSQSSVREIFYNLDGSSAVVPYASFPVTAEGAHSLTVYATDTSGNIESPRTFNFSIDTSAPVITSTRTAANDDGWNKNNVVVSFECSDGISGPGVCPGAITYSEEGVSVSTVIRVFDNAGNYADKVIDGIKIDKTLPSSTATLAGVYENDYYTSSVIVTILSTDTLSGVSGAACLIDVPPDSCGSFGVHNTSMPFGSCQNNLYTGPFTVGIGTHTIYYASRDKAGNQMTIRSESFEVREVNQSPDITAPVTTVTVTGTFGQNNWYISPVAITLVSEDSQSGLKDIFYSLDGSSVVVPSAYVSFPVTTEGAHILTVHATDISGNTESLRTFNFKIDVSSPVVEYSITPSSGPSGWNNTPVAVVFTGTDTVSEVAYCSSPMSVANEGHTSVSGSCTNKAGLSSGVTFVLNIDTTAPVIDYTRTPTNGDGWNNSSVAISFTCADGLSEVASCPAGIELSSEGIDISTSVIGYDHAGNYAAKVIDGIKIDKTLPSSTATLAGVYENGYYASSVTVTIVSTDTLSGIKGTGCFIDVSPNDCGSLVIIDTTAPFGSCTNYHYNGPFTIGVGTHTVYYAAKDKAGNQEGTRSVSFEVREVNQSPDITAPVTTVTVTGTFGQNNWYVSPVTITLVSTDSQSGLKGIFYSLDGSSAVVGNNTFLQVATEGGHLLTAYATDNFGNTESTRTFSFSIDVSAPNVTYSIIPSSSASGWNNTAVDVVFTGTDTVSHIAYCSSSMSVTTEGYNPVSGSCTDNAGLSSSVMFTVKIDTTAPVSTATLAGEYKDGYYESQAVVSIISTDTLSGLMGTGCFIDIAPESCGNLGPNDPSKPFGSCQNYLYTGPFTLAVGTHTVSYSSRDNAGNRETIRSVSFTVREAAPSLDIVPPVTTATIAGVFGQSYWYISPVMVTLVSTDAMSGVKETFCGLDGSTPVVCGSSFTIAAEGQHVLAVYSTDNSSNTETASTYGFKIDTSIPVTGYTLTPPGWTYLPVQVVFTGTDTVSGIAYCSPSRYVTGIDMGSAVSGYCSDNAGLTSSVTFLVSNIDQAAPVSTVSLSGAYSNGVYTGPVEVTIASTDELSGVAGTYYSLDSGTTTLYTGAFTVEVNGPHSLLFYCQDNAGNAEVIHTISFTMGTQADTVPPDVRAWADGAEIQNSGSMSVSTSTVISLTAMDLPVGGPASGLRAVYYSVDVALSSQTAVTYTMPFTLGAGTHTVYYTAMDMAGNMAMVRTAGLNVSAGGQNPDIVAPEVTAWANGMQILNGGSMTVSTGSTVTLSATDLPVGGPASGLRAVYYTVDVPLSSQTAVTYAMPFVLAAGTHTVYYTAVDMAGNMAMVRTAGLNVSAGGQNPDIVAPEVTAWADGMQILNGGSMDVSTGSTITLSATDLPVGGPASGLRAVYYSVDVALSSQTAVTYTMPFMLAAGTHMVYYTAVDMAGNMAMVRMAGLNVSAGGQNIDITPPVITAWVDNLAVPDEGSISIVANSTITLVAMDPLVNGPASGVKVIYYTVDMAFSTQTANYSYSLNTSFALGIGTHTVYYTAVDMAGNQAIVKAAIFIVNSGAMLQDTMPPVTTALAGVQVIPDGGGITLTAGNAITLEADDTAGGAISSGLMGIYYSINTPFNPPGTTYSAPLTLPVGAHVIYYTASDMAGNQAAVKTASITVVSELSDTIPPQTRPYVDGVLVSSGGAPIYLRPGAALTLEASDPFVGDYTSGLAFTTYTITQYVSPDWVTIASGTYSGPIIARQEGYYMLYFHSKDNAGNWEPQRSRQCYVDGTAPRTLAYIDGVLVSAGSTGYVRLGTALTLEANDLPVNGASGVAITTYLKTRGIPPDEVITGSGAYSGPLLALHEGYSTVYYQSRDNSGNLELPNSVMRYIDGTAPVTGALVNGTALEEGTTAYISAVDSVTLTAADPQSNGVAAGPGDILYTVDTVFSTQTATAYTLPFALAAGIHTVYYTAFDNVGNQAPVKSAIVDVRLPVSPSAGPIGMPFTITGGGFGAYSAGTTVVLVGTTTAPLTLWSTTKIQGTIPGSLAAGQYPVSVKRGTVLLANVIPFTVTTPVPASITPASGAIGVPFTLTGANFGNYVANYTKVLIGGVAAPLTLWSDTKIQGTIPGTLSADDYSVVVERALNGGVVTAAAPAQFKVVVPTLLAIIPSSGSIGVGFTLTGENFGNYVANYTRVLIGGTTAPLTLWSDTKIQGTVPGSLSPGTYEAAMEREFNGVTVRSSAVPFVLVIPIVTSIAPSSGAIGVPFTINGANFGNYVANFTRVLIDGVPAPLTLWADTKIQGTVPGALEPGDHALIVERALNGGTVATPPVAFKVVAPELAAVSPSSGAIGIPFTLTGSNFGNYLAGYTNVLIGGATAPLTLWSDTKIQGTIPGSLGSGRQQVLVERRTANGGQIQSAAAAFWVVGVDISSMSPVAGPIGAPFTIYGANFGNYSAGYTTVLIGGVTAPLTLWADTKIQGTIPGGLTEGEHAVVVARDLNGGRVESSGLIFSVALPVFAGISPSSGPIGLPFTITGTNFGNYVANYTKVLIGGVSAPLTLWSDTKIQGTIPGALAPGGCELYVERNLNGGTTRTSTAAFTVVLPVLDTVSPSTAAIIAPFTLTGYNFGNYVANNTKVLVNGITTALTSWSDTKIQGKLPYLPAGRYPVLVQRYLNGGLAESATAYINVAGPVISTMTPATGQPGTVFNLYGTNFGPYDASQTRVTMDGVACALSLWNDTNIRGTVPSGLSGTNMVVVSRGAAQSNGIEFVLAARHAPSAFRTSTLNADFKLGEVYVYPNPAKGGKVPVFHVEVGVADSVKIKVFTVAGQAVHEHTITGSPAAIGGVYAYEYAWDGHIASGVYYYTMEAEKAGRKLKKAGKFAVVR